MENEAALSLMQEALAIYDRTGDGGTIIACRLQMAIDAATGAGPLGAGDEIDPEVLASLHERLSLPRPGRAT